MALIVLACLLLMLLSAVQHERLRARSRLARAALLELRHAQSLRSHARFVDLVSMQLETACTQAGVVQGAGAPDAERMIVRAIELYACTLVSALREKARLWGAVVALQRAAPPVMPLRARELRLFPARGAAWVDTCGRWLLPPLWHLRLHLALLRFGLACVLDALLDVHAPLGAADAGRLAAAGADLATLARASVRAYAAVLRASSPRLADPLRLPQGPTTVM